MKSTFVWRFDEEDPRTVLRAVRITVRTLSMRDYGEHQRLHRWVRQLWEERFPQAPAEGDAQAGEQEAKPDKGEGGERPLEAAVHLDVYRRWSQLAPATCGVEVVQYASESDAAELDPDAWEAWPWASSSLEWLGWNDPDGVMDLPIDFFLAWEKAVVEVNPGIWGSSRTSDAAGAKKKTGLVARY